MTLSDLGIDEAALANAHRPVPAGPTLDEIRRWPATVGAEHAGAALGYSKSWTYQLIAQDDFPARVIKQGSRVRVVTASLLALLEAGDEA